MFYTYKHYYALSGKVYKTHNYIYFSYNYACIYSKKQSKHPKSPFNGL